MIEAEMCKHQWVANSGQGAAPDFRVNGQMSSRPLMHVQCRMCGCRTWFTEAQWAQLPYTSEEEES